MHNAERRRNTKRSTKKLTRYRNQDEPSWKASKHTSVLHQPACVHLPAAFPTSNLRTSDVLALLPLLLHDQSTCRDSSTSDGRTHDEPPPCRTAARQLAFLLASTLCPRR